MRNLRLDADSNYPRASLSLLDARFESEPGVGSGSDAEFYWMECEARIETEDESAEVTLTMIAPYREDTLIFFEKLAALPDNWVGDASWYSEYGKLFIDVHSDGNGFATLQFKVRQPDEPEESPAGELVVRYDAFRTFASSLAEFLRVSPVTAGYSSPSVSPLGRWSLDDGA